VYAQYETAYKNRFRWLPPRLFLEAPVRRPPLRRRALLRVLARCETWQAGKDEKLLRLRRLLAAERPHDKVLILHPVCRHAAR